MRAFEQARALPEARGIDGPEFWQFLGPTNFAGRMISIAINPLNANTIYVGGASGGVWRSFTGGLGGDWHRVSTGFPVLGIGAITIDPSDTSVIYLGTGEVYRYGGSVGGMVIRPTRGSYGLGILKSTDAGVTWSKSLDWSYNQERGIQNIRINPANSRSILAATSEGVYRSTDGGGSWSNVLPVLMARDIAMNPEDTTEVLASCGNFATPGHGVYRSTDGGQSFVQVTGLPSFSGMAVFGTYRANPERIYVHLAESTTVIGTIYRSTNFGQSWTLVNTSTTGDVQGWYARFLAVHPADSSKIIRGAQGLWRSTNGGTTFSQIIHGWADYHNFAQHPTNNEIIYIVDDGGVWRSTNFGSTYTFVGAGLQTSQFYNGFSSSSTDSARALGQVQDHFGYMYTGALSWPSSAVDECGWTAINQQNDNIMYAITRAGGSVYKSTNRGSSFFSSSSGIAGGIGAWNAPVLVASSNPAVLYFGRSIIFKSTNSAGTWTATNGGVQLDGNPALSMAMSATNTDTVYVGTAPYVTRAHIFRTTNGGTTWADITGILPDRYPLDLATNPNNAGVVYVTFGGFGSHVFKSTNAGASWFDVTGALPDVPATAALVDPENDQTVYVGTDLGVYVSTNGGTDWAAYNDGLPEAVIVADLTLSPANRALKLATHSNGVYERALLEAPAAGQPPNVSDIPDQTAPPGGRFTAIRVDNFVADPDNGDTEITWSWTGNSSLIIQWDAVRRRIRVRPLRNWTGSETITFTATDPTGLSDSDPATFTVTATAAEEASEDLFLTSYPNPFNPSVTIGYGLSRPGHVLLKVYNTLGEEVVRLVDATLESGRYSATWDGTAADGGTLAAGLYFSVLTTPNGVAVRKMLFVK
jgi:hypothetical protein